jgi:hypothetical protein
MRLLVPRLLPVVAVLLFSPCLAKAATYYVATTGNDSNACTSAGSPCATITGALGKATTPGSIIQVASGTYNESPTMSSAGTSGNPITLTGSTISPFTNTCPSTAVSDPNHPTGARPNSPVVINGSVSIKASWVTVNCIHSAGVSAGISLNNGLSNINITNNELSGNGALGNNGDGISIAGVGSVASTSYTNNVLIDRNYIHGTTGLFAACSSCTITNNEITALMGSEPGNDHDYIDLWGNGTVVRHNYMHGNTANSCDSYDCQMDCIQTWNTMGNGTEVSKNITFDRNICFNHHEGVIVQDNAGNGDVSNWTVTNNVFAYGPYDDGSGHLAVAGSAHPWCWIFQDGNLGTNSMWNNTCVDGAMGFNEASSGSASYKDNLFLSLSSDTSPYENSGSVTGANNLYYATNGNFSGGTFTGDIINQNPQIVSAGTGSAQQQCIGCNFNIQSTSAAKDKGVATGVTTDLLGTTRPQGSAYDIGAYEYISGGAAPAPPSPPTNLTGTAN